MNKMNNWSTRVAGSLVVRFLGGVGKNTARAVVLVSLTISFLNPIPSHAAGAMAFFNYSMPDRFGLDEDGNGIVDIPNNIVYAQPEGFTLNLNGNASIGGTSPIVSYDWIIEGNGLPSAITMTGPTASVSNLTLGRYSVTLIVTDAEGFSNSTTKNVPVKDILIVAVGDSYGSGEGSVDRPYAYDSFGFISAGLRWADSEQNAQLWGDNQFHSRCHRSAWAGAAQAALTLEQSDPHTSVTFVFMACSGATIEKALIGDEYPGIEPPSDNSRLKSQIDQVVDIVGDRRIDGLIMSAGGNDIGFSNIVKAW